METIMETADKAHYFLIAGVILFAHVDPANPDAEPNMGSAPVNALVRHDSQNFPVRKLAKAQQNLHKSFVTKLPEEAHATLGVHDIVITNVSYLGEMTEEEFQQEDAPVEPEAAPVPERV
jgi:hypothetical protein